MTKQDDLLRQINKVKHNFELLVPTTIELMFDACLGILFEDHAAKVAQWPIKPRTANPIRYELLRNQADAELERNKKLVLYLKQRVTSIYAEVKSESEKNKEKGRKGASQPDGPCAAPTDGEAGPGGGETSA